MQKIQSNQLTHLWCKNYAKKLNFNIQICGSTTPGAYSTNETTECHRFVRINNTHMYNKFYHAYKYYLMYAALYL